MSSYLTYSVGVFLFFCFVNLLVENARFKGWLAEKLVNRLVKRCLPKETAILSNIYLRKSNNKTTEIDHIVVSPTGIYVIETKVRYGAGKYSIFIDKNNLTQWQVRSGKRIIGHMYSPVNQNKTHIAALCRLLGNSYYFNNVVAFLGDYRIKPYRPKNVFCYSELKGYFLAERRKQRRLSEAEIRAIVRRISDVNEGRSFGVKQDHIKEVERAKNKSRRW